MVNDFAVLVVSRSSTECSACGGNADPGEYSHEMTEMPGEGCGARFVAIGTEYVGSEMEGATRAMRPDLPFIDLNIHRDKTGYIPEPVR